MAPRSRSATRFPPAVVAAGGFVLGFLVLAVLGASVGVALFVGIVLAVAGWMWSSRAAKDEAAAASGAPRVDEAHRPGTPRALNVGDVVGADDRMWVVEGSIRFNEGGFVWHEHLLVDGADRWWLSVEDDDGALELVRWNRLRGVELDPMAREVTHDGVTYSFDERGSAAFTSTGSTGAPASGRADYADFEAGDRRLGFERFGGEAGTWEVSVGEVVSEHLLEIYPGTGTPAGVGRGEVG